MSATRIPTGFSRQDIAIVKGMIRRGDRQSDIAAYFGTNGGRISEINTGNAKLGARSINIKPASESRLPPAGPYLAGRSALHARETLLALKEIIEKALVEIELFEQLKKLDDEQ